MPRTVCASLSRICISRSGRAGSAAHKVGGGIVGYVVGAADQAGCGVGRPVGKQKADGESGKQLPSQARAGSVLAMLLKQL